MLRRSRSVANGTLPEDPEGSGDEFQTVEKHENYNVFGGFGQALDTYTPIVMGIGQIYADSDRHWTYIRR